VQALSTPGVYYTYGTVEVLCNKPGDQPVQCDDILVWYVMENPDGSTPAMEGICGHQNGPCEPDGYRNYFFAGFWEVANGGCLPVRTTIYWQLQNGPRTTIRLPVSAKALTMATGSAFSSDWFNVGNGC
jgi:hypothetical protein